MGTAQAASGVEGSQVLFLALELGRREWKLGFGTGIGRRPRVRSVRTGDVDVLEEEVRRAKRRFGLGASARVVSCYEAGRDGFWIHRFLAAAGIQNHVIDSSSIEVKRRRRRRKTDRLDLESLLRLLMRFWGGERNVWSVIRVPSPEAECTAPAPGVANAHAGPDARDEPDPSAAGDTESSRHRARVWFRGGS